DHRPGVRSVRDEQDQGDGAGPRHRAPHCRRAWRACRLGEPGGGRGVRAREAAAHRSRAHAGRPRAPERFAKGTCMSAAHILVVDDESAIRGLLTEILTEEGYEVEAAANAAEARAARANRAPDLVLLDIWMPDVDGITLLREWSAQGGESCPVVMMSGHGTVETAVEATRLGAFDFVEKPLSLAKLLRTVER